MVSTSSCPSFVWLPDVGLVERLVSARGQGYRSAKARWANGYVDRPLLPSEQVRLVEQATRLALG
jgi:hypothetical protein